MPLWLARISNNTIVNNHTGWHGHGNGHDERVLIINRDEGVYFTSQLDARLEIVIYMGSEHEHVTGYI